MCLFNKHVCSLAHGPYYINAIFQEFYLDFVTSTLMKCKQKRKNILSICGDVHNEINMYIKFMASS